MKRMKKFLVVGIVSLVIAGGGALLASCNMGCKACYVEPGDRGRISYCDHADCAVVKWMSSPTGAESPTCDCN